VRVPPYALASQHARAASLPHTPGVAAMPAAAFMTQGRRRGASVGLAAGGLLAAALRTGRSLHKRLPDPGPDRVPVQLKDRGGRSSPPAAPASSHNVGRPATSPLSSTTHSKSHVGPPNTAREPTFGRRSRRKRAPAAKARTQRTQPRTARHNRCVTTSTSEHRECWLSTRPVPGRTTATLAVDRPRGGVRCWPGSLATCGRERWR
jgi:hypothetical protein